MVNETLRGSFAGRRFGVGGWPVDPLRGGISPLPHGMGRMCDGKLPPSFYLSTQTAGAARQGASLMWAADLAARSRSSA